MPSDSHDNAISRIRHILFCLNVIIIIFGIIVFGLSLWVRFDPDFTQWVETLNIQIVYIGSYILIVAALLKMGAGIFGCVSSYAEDPMLLNVNAGVQLFTFLLGLAGAAVLMDYTTYQSAANPLIKKAMLELMSRYPIDQRATHLLMNVQEEMGCCGANGPNDYFDMRRAVPAECRDTVTGNTFFYGCADEITWHLEQKSTWVSGIALALCGVSVIDGVLSLILSKLIVIEDRGFTK